MTCFRERFKLNLHKKTAQIRSAPRFILISAPRFILVSASRFILKSTPPIRSVPHSYPCFILTQCPIVCRLPDFGLTRSVDIQTKSIIAFKTTAIGCGTPAYMAPEMQLNQLVSASQDDLKRADVWSLGLVLHNMVSSDIGSPC